VRPLTHHYFVSPRFHAESSPWERKDGRRQVTYGGHPLYYYEGDRKGQAKCQGVNNAGGIWLVVSPAGKAIR
jgi:predicted lipoprotein with Yx(FWY)xxD motif